MTCDRVTLPGGGTAIVCSSRKRPRCACGRSATLLCDWKVPDKKSGTCDAPMCARCAMQPVPGADKQLCPAHVEAFKKWKADLAAANLSVRR
jgi:hypothetical protein